jgi:hypothetical protein
MINPTYIIKSFIMANLLKNQDFLVKVLNCKKFEKMFLLKLVNSNKWLPRTFCSNLPAGTKSGDLMFLTARIYTNAAGYEAIYISNARPA